MTEQGGTTARWPARIAVIGGGRWARVLTEVVCGIASPSAEISVHSPHNAIGMAEWAASREATRCVQVSSQWPEFASPETSAVIVANAARDHAPAVEWSLRAGVGALVEKPMGTSAAELEGLVDIARERRLCLAPAHIFRFASYLDHFSRLARSIGRVTSLRLWWADPRDERRHREHKRYDPSLPVFADWLPHVLSVVGAIERRPPDRTSRLVVLRGGASVAFDLLWPDLICTIEMARNSDQRRRILEVTVGDECFRLDFSEEPPTAGREDRLAVVDPEWTAGPRPSARMLTAFLTWVAGGEPDGRLGLDVALCACRLSDQLAGEYRAIQLPWLAAKLGEAGAGPVDEDLRYALEELLQSGRRLPSAAIEQQIERLRHAAAGITGARLSRALEAAADPGAALRAMAI